MFYYFSLSAFFCLKYSDWFYYSLGPEVLDEEGTQEDLEYKLKGFIDLTLDKRWELLEAVFILGDFDQPPFI